MTRLRNNPRMRVRDLLLVFEDKLLNDVQGRRHLRLILDHIALYDGNAARRLALRLIPELSDSELDQLIDAVGTGKYWPANDVGAAIGLDEATRDRLGIRTIASVEHPLGPEALLRARKRREAAERRAARKATANTQDHSQ